MHRAIRKNSKLKPAIRTTRRRQRGEPVAVWLDSDVIDHFVAKGPGWQVRINAALRKAAGL